MLQYGETPTDALQHASALIDRSYANLHALWRHWRHEQEIFVVDTHHRGAGAATHLHHAHHVSVDVMFYITEYIREANQTGGGCTSKALQDAILAEHHTRLSDRVLRSVLPSMGFRYGRGNVIGKMNDPSYVARIRDPTLAFKLTRPLRPLSLSPPLRPLPCRHSFTPAGHHAHSLRSASLLASSPFLTPTHSHLPRTLHSLSHAPSRRRLR